MTPFLIYAELCACRNKNAMLLGLFLVLIGFGCTCSCVKCLYELDTSRWYIPAAIGSFLLACAFILHGMFYAFFGHWDELYRIAIET